MMFHKLALATYSDISLASSMLCMFLLSAYDLCNEVCALCCQLTILFSAVQGIGH